MSLFNNTFSAPGLTNNPAAIEKRKLELLEEDAYIKLMTLSAAILKQPPNLINMYEQEILRISEARVRARYGT